ncbi:TetR family transcriptional regulator C-terminal domain-containing protein [Streptomyces sp. N2-109]|uniref:TetR family transcriptional regulator C-terminal domain-containing protein n=1 Tax=Streptomyces gossypii TaxID=2883101 RepID=A0ABT2K375_9ACTN|nr:TetR family transcriptional regulator C-terminal domain-containing protein [Streptomyces gossypii]MCT2594628.1 TetR family transcriptional regulator C-terminal domain-containing protein [Streptomyces gossypii]
MPPARGDHEARRADVSEAVWRVLAAKGLGGLTLRAVAAEMDASTGLLTHYFPTKRALVRHALVVAEERTSAFARRTPEAEGLASLRAALLDVLPLTPGGAAMNRVWVSSWDASLADPELRANELARLERWRGRLRAHVVSARERGELPEETDADEVTASAAAFTHGLVVHALFDPDRFPPERQTALLDGFLRGITG